MSVLNELNNLYELDLVGMAKQKLAKLSPDEKAATLDKKIDSNEESKLKSSVDKIKSGISKGNIAQKLDQVKGGIEDAGKELNPTMFKSLMDVYNMVQAYISGEYKDIPWETVLTLAGVLLYVFSPIDVIPDVIPVAGWIDDGWVITRLLPAMKKDIDKYNEWKESQGPVEEPIV